MQPKKLNITIHIKNSMSIQNRFSIFDELDKETTMVCERSSPLIEITTSENQNFNEIGPFTCVKPEVNYKERKYV